jgi:hypothetical protein
VEKRHTAVLVRHQPFGDSPQGQRRAQRPGMIAAYARAQLAARTRRGRLETARRGECLPGAYRGNGDRALPQRHGGAPQVVREPSEAPVVRAI